MSHPLRIIVPLIREEVPLLQNPVGQLSPQLLPLQLPSWDFLQAGVWETEEKLKCVCGGSFPPLWGLGDSFLLFEPELDNFSWSSLCLCRCPHSGFVLLTVEPGVLEEKDNKLTTSLMVLQILVLPPSHQLLFNFQSPWKAAVYLLPRFLPASSVEYVYTIVPRMWRFYLVWTTELLLGSWL